MVEPRTVREVSIDLDAFKGAVEWRLGFLIKLGFMMLTALVAVIGGGLAIYWQIGDFKDDVSMRIGAVKTDIAVVNTKIDAIDARTKRLETSSDAGVTSQKRIEDSLARLEARQAPPIAGFTPLTLSSDETKNIRDYFSLKGPVKGPPRHTLGETVLQIETKPIPDDLVRSVPKLKGFRYLIDESGYVAIADGANRVAAIVGPPSA